MSFSSSQIDSIIASLEAALGSGAAEVTFENRRIVYRTQEEIFKGLDYFKGLRNSAAGSTRVRQIRLSGSKGL